MFTVKRIVEGDRSPLYLESYTLGDRNSRAFKHALEIYERSNDDASVAVLEAEPIDVLKSKSVDTVTPRDLVVTRNVQKISAVELRYEFTDTGHDPIEVLSVATRDGTHTLDEAIGVLVFDPNEREGNDEEYVSSARYEFIYPGDQVFVTDPNGHTVDSIR